MTSSKPWYLSRTIWASLVSIAAAAGGLIGLPVETGDVTQITDLILQTISGVAGVIAIVGRLSATARIG